MRVCVTLLLLAGASCQNCVDDKGSQQSLPPPEPAPSIDADYARAAHPGFIPLRAMMDAGK